MELRLDQHEAVDLQGAVQQRPDLQLDLDRLQAHHARARAAGRVGERHLLRLEAELRQEGEAERTVDRQVAAGRALDLDGASMRGGDRFDEAQPQPETALGPARVPAEQALPDSRKLLGQNAGPLIAHEQPRAVKRAEVETEPDTAMG